MSTFIIKIIAMITMFCDHLSRIVYGANQTTFLNYIGRFAFLLFCFQLVLGYKKTKSLKKYLLRLLIIGIISQLPYSLFFNEFSCMKDLNVCFTLFLGLISISILNAHKENNRITFRDNNYNSFNITSYKSIISLIIKIVLISILCYLVSISNTTIGYGFEYNYKAILFMISIYLFYPFDNKNNITKIILYILSVIIFSFAESQSWFGSKDLVLPVFNSSEQFSKYLFIYLFCIIGGLIPLLYNGKKGKSIKWITYLFYPLHLLLLYIIYIIIK